MKRRDTLKRIRLHSEPLFIAHVSVGNTNRNPLAVLDDARRQIDHLGPAGIIAKRKQTNDRYREYGFLRFAFSSAALRQRYADRVKENCDGAVKVVFYRRRRR